MRKISFQGKELGGQGQPRAYPKALNQWCEFWREGSWNHNFEMEPQRLESDLSLFSQAFPSLVCCRVKMCVKRLGQAQFLPGDQEFLSWLRPLHSCIPLSQGCCSTHPAGAGSLEQLQPGSFWSHTELNLEQVLWDQWCFSRIKPLYERRIIPDQMSLSAATAAPAQSGSECLHLPGCSWVLAFTSASAWGSRRAS